MLIAGLRHS
jgi:hypothetical protein